MMPAAPPQVTGVDEITRQAGASVKCSWPVVVVSSEYVPSALAVNVPVTVSMPVTGADGQPAPTSVRSSEPLTVRHDDATVQAPTMLPPHAVTLGQGAPPLPVPAVPVVAALPEPPPEPVDPTVPGLHAAENIPATRAEARAVERTFMTEDWRRRAGVVNKNPRFFGRRPREKNINKIGAAADNCVRCLAPRWVHSRGR
jgi:hypothetical protein